MADVVDLDAYRQKPTAPAPLETGGGGGDSNGMDPWQQTVETRLGELRGDARAIATDVGALRAEVATLTERVSGLPTKGFIVKAAMSALALIAALLALQTGIQNFVLAKPPAVAQAQK